MVEESNIAGQRSAGKRRAGREIGLRSDSAFGFQTALDLFRIGAYEFANRRDLIGKYNGDGKKSVDGMFCHLRRLNRHPFNSVSNRPQQTINSFLIPRRSHSDNNTIRFEKHIERFTEAQILGGIRKTNRLRWAEFLSDAFQSS